MKTEIKAVSAVIQSYGSHGMAAVLFMAQNPATKANTLKALYGTAGYAAWKLYCKNS
ncbi:hypothetical protein ACKLNO_03645 [Neisseriaceae bacterium B1]